MRISIKYPSRLSPQTIRLVACTVFIVGGGLLTGTAYILTQQRITTQTNLKFEEVTAGHVQVLSHYLETYSDTLYATSGLFAASEVDANAWNRFVQAQLIPRRHPGMKSVAFAEVVSQQNIAAYLKEQQNTQDPAIHVHPEKTEGDYIVLTYHQDATLTSSEKAKSIGFDISSKPERLQSLEQARLTGTVTATAPVKLITNNQPGFLLVLPLHDKNGAYTDQPFGYGILAFEIEPMIRETIGTRLSQYKNAMTITDITDSKRQLLYQEAPPRSWGRTVSRGVAVQVANRTWEITFSGPATSLIMVTDRMAPMVVLVAGIGFIFLACIFIYTIKLRTELRRKPSSDL